MLGGVESTCVQKRGHKRRKLGIQLWEKNEYDDMLLLIFINIRNHILSTAYLIHQNHSSLYNLVLGRIHTNFTTE
jgi:hypothetical protein